MNFRLLTLSAAVFGLLITTSHASEIRLHGDSAVTDNLLMSHKAEIESVSGHRLLITETTITDGIADMATDIAQIAMISASLDDVVEDVNTELPGTVEAGLLQAHKVGEARIVFTVNPGNQVRDLTSQQITHILNGTITNWSTLGGADQPIVIVSERTGGPLRALVEERLLEGRDFSGKRREVLNQFQIPDLVEGAVNAFGVMSSVNVNERIVQVQTDVDIIKPLYFVTKRTPSADVQAVIDAAKSVGGMEE